MKAIALAFVLLLNLAASAQTSINNYRYVIVPIQFDFSKEDNQYGLNTATKEFLVRKGFVVFLDNETLPPALAGNRCNGLMASYQRRSTMFTTALTLILKDCQGNIVFKSKEGKSREKDYAAAYQGAMVDACASLDQLAYKYDSTPAVPAVAAGPGAVAPAVAAGPATAAPVAPATTAPATAAPVSTPAVTSTAATSIPAGALYAQVIPNGYQLVDTSPRKILTLLKTSIPDYYIAQAGASNGVVFKKNGEWFFEHYEGDKLVSQKLDIKF